MANPYLEMELRTAPPELVVGRLLDRAVAMVNAASEQRELSSAESTRAVARAVDIVSELRCSLDLEAGGEIAANLDGLYGFVAVKLMQSGAKGAGTELADALAVLEHLAGTWAELIAQREEVA